MTATPGWLVLLCIGLQASVCAQTIVGDKAIVMKALLDSAEWYELRAPAKSLQFALTVTNSIPVEGNEAMYVRALLYAANSEKIGGGRKPAIDYANRAIAIAHRVNDANLLVRSYFMKGTIFGQVDEEDSTLIYYQKVIEYNQSGIDPYFLSQAYSNIASVYGAIGNDEKAEEYFLQGYRQASSEYAKLFILAELIGFYSQRNNPKYLPYLDTLAMTDFYRKATPASQMAHFDSFLRLDKTSDREKEAKLREVYTYSKSTGNPINQIGYGMKLVEFLTVKERHEEAFSLLQELLATAEISQSGRRMAFVLHALYENCRTRGNMQDALKYLERHSTLRDSLVSEENRTTISELNIKFESAQKDFEIGQQKVKLDQAHRNRNFLIILALLLSALAGVIFIYFRNRARAAHKIASQEKVIRQQETERLVREKEVAELTASLETQERERNRIARDLHDGLGSLMSGISAQIETLRAQPMIESSGSPHLTQLRDMVKDATAELRRTSYELMPASLLRQGLEPAIRDLAMNLLVKNGVTPALEINADLTKLSSEQQLTIYRITQELLNNVVKHAQANNVLVQFNQYDDEFSLIVEDDGKGFDIAEKRQTGGLGLGSLQSRVNLLKGFLDIASVPGEGTTITINFSDQKTKGSTVIDS
jgi:signal transduction histidine kinase